MQSSRCAVISVQTQVKDKKIASGFSQTPKYILVFIVILITVKIRIRIYSCV
jgi:hypothetical protein